MIQFSGDRTAIKGRIKIAKALIKSIASDHGFKKLQIDYIFVDDNALLEINRSVLQHDFYTDIITFDYSSPTLLEAEIYISTERVRENAAKYKEDFESELMRVIIHGVLHMVGYKDKSKTQKAEMREKENHYLKQMRN